MAQKFVLPAIKTAFPQTTSVVTGVRIIWASADLWKTMSDNEVDTTKAVIKTFEVAQRAVELVLQVNDVPTLAIQSNQIAGFALTTADTVYALQLKRRGKGK